MGQSATGVLDASRLNIGGRRSIVWAVGIALLVNALFLTAILGGVDTRGFFKTDTSSPIKLNLIPFPLPAQPRTPKAAPTTAVGETRSGSKRSPAARPTEAVAPVSSQSLQPQPAAASAAAPGRDDDEVQARVRAALRDVAACSSSRSESTAFDQPPTCARRYGAIESPPPASAFIDPLKRSGYDQVAAEQEKKRSVTSSGAIVELVAPCTGRSSGKGFGCLLPKPRTGSLWDSTAKGDDPQ